MFICSLFHAIFTKCISDMNLLPICETMENRKRKGEYELTMFGSTKLRGCEDFWKCEGHEWENAGYRVLLARLGPKILKSQDKMYEILRRNTPK